MAAPYKPTLIQPINGDGAKVNPLTFKWIHNAPDALFAGAYTVRRRRLTPTIGSIEYLTDAGSWTTTPTDRSAVAGIQDGEEISIIATGTVPATWTEGSVYEWYVQMKDSGAVLGATSDTALFVAKTALTMTLNIETPATDSRPVIRWLLSDATLGIQSSYRLAVYDNATTLLAGFSADDPAWQALAVWIMDEEYISSTTFRHTVGVDLAPSTSYKAYGFVRDRYGVTTGWHGATSFSTSFTPPQAASVTFDPDPENGIMNVQISSAFNLVPEASSSFDSGIGAWTEEQNVQIEHDAALGRLKCNATGMTYAQADTLYTTYAAQDTGQGTYSAQQAARSTEATYSIISMSTADLAALPSVTATLAYSAILTVKTLGFPATARLSIIWLTAAGAVISTSNGADTSVGPGVDVGIPTGTFAAPATATKAALRLRITTAVGNEFYVDNVAMAQTSDIAWSPGGLSVDLEFALARRVDGGDWEFVWHASREDPANAGEISETIANIPDRSYPMGRTGVEYQAVVITTATGKNVASTPVVVESPYMEAEKWFLRCFDGSLPDARLRAIDFSKIVGSSNQVSYVSGASHGIVQESDDAAQQAISADAWLFDLSEYETVMALLRSKKLLYIQRNIGDGFYIRVTGTTRATQQRAANPNGSVTPRHLHRISFDAEVVSTPKDLVS